MGTRWVIVAALVAVVVGLLAGYFMWARPTRDVARQLDEAKTRLSEQGRRADDLQSKLTETEAELKRAAEGLQRERELREKFEDLVNKGRK
jgi:hypothetical protein